MTLDKTTSYLFSEVTNFYRNEFEKRLNEIGLHSGQVFVLQLLYLEDGQSQIDLAKKLNLSPPTINSMVKSLEKNSFVKSKKCKMDGRVMRVFLTTKATEFQETIREKWLQFDEDFFSSLTPTERLVLFQLLEKLKSDFINNS